jgi:RNA polymerase sigma-70 factor, ECF subfamily
MLPEIISHSEVAWRQVEAPVRGYLRRRLGRDGTTADDLVQEVFLRVSRGLSSLTNRDRLGPWVMRIARHVLIDHQRRKQGVPLSEQVAEQADHPQADDVSDLTECTEISRFISALLAAQPESIRSVIQLVDLHGMTGPEAAKRLGIGLPALKARLRRGRERMREEIELCCRVVLDGRGNPTDYQPRGRCATCREKPG